MAAWSMVSEWQRPSDALSDAFDRVMDRLAEGAIFDARKRSRGTFSYPWMKRMDHPYSRRNPGSILSLPLLNRHQGQVYEGWKTRRIGRFAIKVENKSKRALWTIEGTKTMAPRYALEAAIDNDITKRFYKYMEQELSKWQK